MDEQKLDLPMGDSPIHHLPRNHCSSDQNISMFGCTVNRIFERANPENLSTSDELNMDQLTLWDWDRGAQLPIQYGSTVKTFTFLAQFFLVASVHKGLPKKVLAKFK